MEHLPRASCVTGLPARAFTGVPPFFASERGFTPNHTHDAGDIIPFMKRVLGCFVLVIVALAASAQYVGTVDVPAYNAAKPSRPLPAILGGQQLTGQNFVYPYQVTVYKMAAKIPSVLHQEPCYCHCDRAMGHNSLHSCFEGFHGAECSTCMKEAAYSYQETKRGRTPAQIRAGIERGEWMNVDLEKVAL